MEADDKDASAVLQLDLDLDDWKAYFQGAENIGAKLSEDLALILSGSMRSRPNDDTVKSLAKGLLIPENVPELSAPTLNDDVKQVMGKGFNILDKQLYLSNGLLGKAMVPLLKIIDDKDLCHQKVYLSKDHLQGISKSVKLLAAVFNYVNHSRRENVRNGVRDDTMKKLCSWDCKVGAKELFPFNVSKRCTELRKSKNLGRFKSWRDFKSNYRRGGFGKFSGRGAKQPFLGFQPRGRGKKFP